MYFCTLYQFSNANRKIGRKKHSVGASSERAISKALKNNRRYGHQYVVRNSICRKVHETRRWALR